MIAFITSMRHPDNADDYSYNEELLEATLRSLTQQSTTDYVVIIVGNQAPRFALPERVQFVQVDFEPPARVNGPHADRSGFVRDKGTKIGVGLLAAKEYAPDWVMIFDADDFVHRDLAKFVSSSSNTSGWVVTDGLIYSRSRNGYRKQGHFNRTCGTSYVIPFAAYEVPEDLDVTASQDALVDAYGDVLPNIMGAHRNAVAWHRKQGRDLVAIPFPAAVYHVDTGENHSGKALPGLIRPWDRHLAAEFAIEPTRSPWSSRFAAWGPMAVAQSSWATAKRLLGPAYRLVKQTVRASR